MENILKKKSSLKKHKEIKEIKLTPEIKERINFFI